MTFFYLSFILINYIFNTFSQWYCNEDTFFYHCNSFEYVITNKMSIIMLLLIWINYANCERMNFQCVNVWNSVMKANSSRQVNRTFIHVVSSQLQYIHICIYIHPCKNNEEETFPAYFWKSLNNAICPHLRALSAHIASTKELWMKLHMYV